ncbi:MAG TPA: DUF5693 family protein [Fervidobacterium nodosum]|nr:DUF5693 family protein [Fervidobacterium nodosum]
MKIHIFPKSEKYIEILITVFSVILLLSIFFRVPIDKENTAVAFFFEGDSRVLFYTGSEKIEDNVELVIPVGNIKESPQDFLKKVNGKYVGNMEFYGATDFVKEFYEKTGYKKIVKVHYIKPEEIPKYDAFKLFKRFWRAVVERSIEVIVVPNSETSVEAYKIFSNFFQVSMRIPEPDDATWNNKIFGILLGIYVTLQMPFAVLSFLFFKDYWFYVSLVSILGTIGCYFSTKNNFFRIVNFALLGILTNFSLYSFQYLNDLEIYRGVKISLVLLPSLLAVIIFTKLGKENIFKKSHIITFSIIGLLSISYMILRSGNYGFVTKFEEDIRLLLENIFIVRPRTKEIIFIPILLLSTEFENAFTKALFSFFGTFALVSIFNSFCHIKAPIYVLTYRETITILIGVTIYFFVVTFIKLINIWTGKE